MSTTNWRGGFGCLALLASTLALPSIPAAADLTASDSNAICRVLYAEAAGQPIAGKVAVVEVVLNRMRINGTSAEQEVNKQRQFEPVTRVGGSWHNLRTLTPAEHAECNAILQLKAGGWLTDVAPGADHFQNPSIVAKRAKQGTVKSDIVNFAGMHVVSQIGDHRFYQSGVGASVQPKTERNGMSSMFAGQDDVPETDTQIISTETP